jgi:hypothetical protein
VVRRTTTLVVVAAMLHNHLWSWVVLALFFVQQLNREKITIRRGGEMSADSFAYEAIGDRETLKLLFAQLEELQEEDWADLLHVKKADRKLQHLVFWRLFLLNQGKRRLANGKSPKPGITFGGPDDAVMSLLFVWLAWRAPDPGMVPLLLLSGFLFLPLFYDTVMFRHMWALEKRMEDAVGPTTAGVANRSLDQQTR